MADARIIETVLSPLMKSILQNPRFVIAGGFAAKTVEYIDYETHECPVCYESLEEGGIRLPCGHHFHGSCVADFRDRCCAICREPVEGSIEDEIDIDIFVLGQEDATNDVRELRAKLNEQFDQVLTFVSEHAVTFVCGDKNVLGSYLPNVRKHVVQVILRKYKLVDEILHGFDLPASQVALVKTEDGIRAWGTHSFFAAQATGSIWLDPERQSKTFLTRALKYQFFKGYMILLFGLNRAAVNMSFATDPKGLGQFLWAETQVGLKVIREQRHAKRNVTDKTPLGVCKRFLAKLKKNPEHMSDYADDNQFNLPPISLYTKGILKDRNIETCIYPIIYRKNTIFDILQKMQENNVFRMESQFVVEVLDLPKLERLIRENRDPITDDLSWNVHDPMTQVSGSFHPVAGDFYKGTVC